MELAPSLHRIGNDIVAAYLVVTPEGVTVIDAVFVGDALTTRHVTTGHVGPAPAPFTDEPDQALASLDALLETGATWVLPGHGTPWDGGVDAAVSAVRAAAH